MQRRGGNRAISGAISGLHDPGDMPAASESRKIQRQHRRATGHSRDGDAKRGARDRYRNRERRGGPGQAGAVSRPRAGGRFVPQLRGHAADGYGGEPRDAGPGRCVQSGNDRAEAVRQRSRAFGGEGAAERAADRAGDGRAGVPDAGPFAGVRRGLHLRGADVRPGHRGGAGECALPAPSVPGGKAEEERQDLRRDCGPDPAHDFPGGTQPRVPVEAHGCGIPAVSGFSGAPARFLFDGRETAAGGLQRNDSAQAENHPLPGRGGSAGTAHRRRKHGVAQGREMARNEHRRSLELQGRWRG